MALADSDETTTKTPGREESYSPHHQPDMSTEVGASLESKAVLQTHSSSLSFDNCQSPSLCIAVIGATGELARTKIFPALFALYYSGFLPEVEQNLSSFHFGYLYGGFSNLISS